jgi:NADPH:quinone reductase-like Zn-dependent oxidoreductase
MKAIVQHTYGSPDVLKLREIDTPEIGDDEVLVRVHAAGVDRGVWHLMTGLPYLTRLAFGLRAPRNSVPGMDVAGVVEAVGGDVTRFRLLDRARHVHLRWGSAAHTLAPVESRVKTRRRSMMVAALADHSLAVVNCALARSGPSWTSTTSMKSTTGSDTKPATGCWRRSAGALPLGSHGKVENPKTTIADCTLPSTILG